MNVVDLTRYVLDCCFVFQSIICPFFPKAVRCQSGFQLLHADDIVKLRSPDGLFFLKNQFNTMIKTKKKVVLSFK